MFDNFLKGQTLQVQSFQCQHDLLLTVTQDSQRGRCFTGLILGNDGNAAGKGLHSANGELPFCHFILQFQNNALRDLFADTRRRGQCFFVTGNDGHGKSLRAVVGQNSQRRFRTNTGNADQHLKAVQFSLCGKAVQLKNLFLYIEICVKLVHFPPVETADRMSRCFTGITYSSTVNNREVGRNVGHGSLDVIKHG